MRRLEFTVSQTEDEALVLFLEEGVTGDKLAWDEFLAEPGKHEYDG